MGEARILLIDDDPALRKALRIGLGARGHELIEAATGEQGVTQVSLREPDVVVLDLGLPDVDGVEVCRRIRTWTSVPIIVLSAAGSDSRKVAALDAGADDYVTKPFSMAELEARVRVALRHAAKAHPPDGSAEITVGPLHVDLLHHMALLGEDELDLTGREFDLLAYLARHAGKICTHQMILKEVWGTRYGSESHYIRVYAHRLRRKFGDEAGMLETLPGVGYRLSPAGNTARKGG